MANRPKDYADSRIERINIAVTPVAKDNLNTLAAIAKITTNELLNRIIDEFIKRNDSTLKKYASFTENVTLDFGGADTVEPNTNVAPVRKKVKAANLNDTQKQEAIAILGKFYNENPDRFVNEGEEVGEAIGVRLSRGGVAFLGDKVLSLIDDSTVKALAKRHRVNDKATYNIILLEDAQIPPADATDNTPSDQ